MAVVEGRRIVVLGGAGAVGEGVCRVLLQQGARLAVPARSEEQVAGLREALGEPTGLLTMVGEAGDRELAAGVRDEIVSGLGGVDDVIVSFGGWTQGDNLVDADLSIWTDRVANNNVLAHMVATQTWLPLLLEQNAGSFLLMNGGAGLEPFPTAGFVSIAAAAQLMLKDVLVAEHPDTKVRINSLVLMTPIFTRKMTEGDPAWLSNDEVGTMCAHLLSDAGASIHGQSIEYGSHDQTPTLQSNPST